ncbi:MAG: NADP-dependent oxidoreductase [Hyphomicrobiales bacterium]|nr:NADP-dependent oxidoreductase [Hyphomicrobiales bacterium]
MNATAAQRIYLARYPEGMPTDEDLKLESIPLPTPGSGEMLLRTIYLSLDPYMRGRMSPAKSYAKGVQPGDTMVGATVSEVMESDVAGFEPGDIVLSYDGWQTHAVSNGKGIVKLDLKAAPVTTALGVLGMPGFTAYAGLLEHGRPKEGETVVVSAASGAVGQIVGQIAKLRGCHAVGIAGADDKCRMILDEFGFDSAVNYKNPDFRDRLAEACPKGVDVYFENVGGDVFRAVLPLLNDFARIPVCGRIAHYNDTALPEGLDRLPQFMGMVLTKRLSVRGFIQFDHLDLMPDFRRDMTAWIADGTVRYREDIVDGLENTVEAFRGLLTGKNRGKLIVRVSDDPTL